MKKTAEFFLVFSAGAVIYSLIEVIFRGYTHWSMTLTGGAAFLIIYLMNTRLSRIPLITRCALGAVLITFLELAVGYLVNLKLGLDVWDYSQRPFNLLGQICPLFTALWFLINFPAAALSRVIREKMIGARDYDAEI